MDVHISLLYYGVVITKKQSSSSGGCSFIDLSSGRLLFFRSDIIIAGAPSWTGAAVCKAGFDGLLTSSSGYQLGADRGAGFFGGGIPGERGV